MWLLVRESVYWIIMKADNRMHSWAMQHMPGRPANTTPGKSITLWNTMQAMGNDWCKCVPWLMVKTSVYCRLPRLVPNSEESKQLISRWCSAYDPADFCRVLTSKSKMFQMWAQTSWLRHSKPSAGRGTFSKTITSTYHHWSRGQVEACIHFVKKYY